MTTERIDSPLFIRSKPSLMRSSGRRWVIRSSILSLPSMYQSDRKSTRLNSSHTVIYTLSLHDALPIYRLAALHQIEAFVDAFERQAVGDQVVDIELALHVPVRSEEHTSELQSHSDLHSFPTRRSSDLSTRRSSSDRSLR